MGLLGVDRALDPGKTPETHKKASLPTFPHCVFKLPKDSSLGQMTVTGSLAFIFLKSLAPWKF